MTRIARRVLGRTGLEISMIGFGAEALGRVGRSADDAARTLNAVLDMRVSLIDTASAYGNSEAFIGRSIAQRKSEFTLVTKCGWNSDWSPAWSPADIERTIDRSLRDLHVDCLDVLLLHSCPLADLRKGEALAVIKAAQSQGKVRFIGYSGDNDALQYAVECGEFDVVECSFSILDQANAPHIAAAQEKNIGVLIKRPIANAIPGRSEKPRSEYASQYWQRWLEFAKTRPSSYDDQSNWLDLAVRFSGFWTGVSCVLVGSSHASHMQDNLDSLNRGPLPDSTTSDLVTSYQIVGGSWPALG